MNCLMGGRVINYFPANSMSLILSTTEKAVTTSSTSIPPMVFLCWILFMVRVIWRRFFGIYRMLINVSVLFCMAHVYFEITSDPNTAGQEIEFID